MIGNNIVSVYHGSNSIAAIKRGADTVFSKETPIALSYITDGLVADFRGEDDYVDGAWVDRVSGYKFTPVSESTAPVHDATNKLYEATQFGGMLADFTTGTTFSFEFVLRDVKNVVKSNSNNYAAIIGTNMSDYNMKNGVTVIKNKTSAYIYCHTWNESNSVEGGIPINELTDGALDVISIIPNVGFFHNGVKFGDTGSTITSGNIGLFTHYNGSYASSYRAKGKIHAVRKYTRALTAEEVLANYQTDVLIYGN